jgi:hypothetical protein
MAIVLTRLAVALSTSARHIAYRAKTAASGMEMELVEQTTYRP